VLQGLANVLRDNQCLIVTDDIYEKLLYIPERFVNIANVAPDLVPRTVVVNGMSKAFAMTGWRLGYAAGPTELIHAMQTVQDQSTSNSNSIAQKAALAALRGPTDEQKRMVKEFQARRDLFVSGLNSIPGIRCRSPEGAFYLFPNIHGLFGKKYKGNSVTGSIQFSELLLDDFRVAAVAGLPFGAEGHLRFSFVTSRAVIEKGLAQLQKFVDSLT
jgi:aspartate aminotransferase